MEEERLKEKLLNDTTLKQILRDIGRKTKRDRREFVDFVIRKILMKNPNVWNLEHKTIPALEKKGDEKVEALKRVLEIIKGTKDLYGLKYEEEATVHKTEEEQIREIEEIEEIEGVIGRVSITQSDPATPYSFSFWLKDSDDIYVEPGEMIEVRLDQDTVIIGMVEDVSVKSEKRDIIEHFYSWSFGQAERNIPTRIPTIKTGKARIVYRSDGKTAPLTYAYPVYKSRRDTLERAFSSMIKEDQRILMGFVRSGDGAYVPVYGPFTGLFGYSSGHVNITGKSGLAGKTSYALFLIASALSYSMQMEELSRFDRTLGIIAFNVKERDLLDIGEIDYSNMEEAIEDLYQKDDNTASLWDQAYRYYEESLSRNRPEYRVDPIRVFRDETTIYEPGSDFSYGLQDLLSLGVHTIAALLDPSDINEQMESLLISINDEFNDRRTSFRDLMRELNRRLSGGGTRGGYVTIGNAPHHEATVRKFINRINRLLSSRVIVPDLPHGNPLNVYDLGRSELWVINIEPLKDNEQRMVFFSVLSALKEILPLKKREEKYLNENYIGDFPSRVSVFVDELNKFAPSGREGSTIKSFIKEIAARGRGYGLTLIGAEQFASQIDEEVLQNSFAFLVGKSEEIELSNRFYKRLSDGMRQRVSFLRRGELVLLHDRLEAPLVVRFPKPLHRLGEE